MKSRLKVTLSKDVLDAVPESKQIDPRQVYIWLWNYWGFQLVREELTQ